jgi:GTP-binding protein LepA
MKVEKFDSFPISNIRNFSIIAHIDHGKSTLADRILAMTGVTNQRTQKNQILDDMDIERERGITIKLNTASFWYKSKNGSEYLFNLIDTPGHADFSYEVSRSLAACEGVLLLVDATQGVEAQTLANLYLAMDLNLTILPIINKIDLRAADVPWCRNLISQVLGLDGDLAIPISAKLGSGIEDVMEAIVNHVPPPSGKQDSPLQALIYDCWFDKYQGAIVKVRIVNGFISQNDKIKMMFSDSEHFVTEIGFQQLRRIRTKRLNTGQVGYIIAGIKTVSDVKVGDTITSSHEPAEKPLKGYREVLPMVFSGLFPANGEEFRELGDAISKLKLNDSALSYETESSEALGFGFRVGYLGLLHMEVVQERLEREFDLALITTSPNVKYKMAYSDGKTVFIENPAYFPKSTKGIKISEPYVKLSIISPDTYIGNLLNLALSKRGEQENLIYLTKDSVQIIYNIPLAEIIFDFYDKLKSLSRGYASMDYEIIGYRESELVRVDILVNNEVVDALALICHKNQAVFRGREIISKLKDIIPRHQFQIPIQACIGQKIIARENIQALRKNVTAKCYGGDITRKRKLLEKQKEGKRRMKSIGSVEVPQEAFLTILRTTNK